MKPLLILILPLITVASVSGQTTVSGIITDMKGNPVNLANVVLVGSYEGASSDATGTFQFTASEEGSRELQVTSIGFQVLTFQIELNGHPISLSLQLQEEVRSLEAVTISAGSFTAGDQSRRTIFRAIDIATTAGATADIAGALNTLPGTQKAGESGRLFVRGGDGSETRTFIDGQLVLDAYSPSAPNTPSRGRFLPFMFKGTSFSTGGYSAEYGQALSSALVLDSKDKAETTRTDFGLLSVGADAGHTQAWERGSLAGKLQYTNIQPYVHAIKQNIDWRSPPESVQGQAAFRHQSGKHGLLKIYGNFHNSHLALNNESIDDKTKKQLYDVTNRFNYLNGFYKNMLGQNWMVRGGFSWTSLYDDILSGDIQTTKQEKSFHGKAVFEGSLSKALELTTGLEIIDHHFARKATNRQQQNVHEIISSVFAETDLYITSRFVARTGGRLEYNSLNENMSIDPRISLAWKPGSAGQISLAYGKFRQSAGKELLSRNSTLESEKADHYILNYQRIENNRTFRIEGYYKRYSHLVKFKNGDETAANNSGYGFAKGIELFWRDTQSLKNVDYWISYSLLDTRRNYLSFPVEATPTFASKHNISVVYKQFLPCVKSQPGLTWSFTSGRPYHNPNTLEFNGHKTRAYVDLSFNWSYLPKPSLILYFSCTNVLGRENIFGYQFSRKPNEQGLYNARAIGLPATRFLFAGVFITLSKERSVNQLPNL